MAHIQFTDELVREYLLFRGFSNALKAFDSDLKLDKDKGFRVDKIVDQLLQYIYTYDLMGLREFWNHLDSRLFIRLEQHFTPSVRKLENAILKFYVVNASENNKHDKITEFFNKLTPELLGQNEWKDWFVFPFIKNSEEHPTFGMYYTKQWQDTLFVSLYNFLAATYQCMPQPTLASFEENASKIIALKKENEIIRKGLINLIKSEEKNLGPELILMQNFDGIMDDFFDISQEIKTNESQTKILKTLMKNIGSMPSSPKLESKEQPVRTSHRKHSLRKLPLNKRSLSIDARPTYFKSKERDSSLDKGRNYANKHNPLKKDEAETVKIQKESFLFLSREEYSEHKTQITSIKFNSQGNLVASADVDGKLKIWSTSPSCKTLSSFSSKNPILCLDWIPNYERYIICGTKNGFITLFDIKDLKSMWSLNMESENTSGKGVQDVSSSPSDSNVITVLSGKLFLIDLKTCKMEKTLNINAEATCARLPRASQLAIVGTEEGIIILIEIRKNEILESWNTHQYSVFQLEISADNTQLYTFSRDKICCRSINQSKSKVFSINMLDEIKLYPELHGRLFCLDRTGNLLLTVGVNSGVIYRVNEVESNLIRKLELGGHKTMVTCLDWTFANQCATCITASRDGKIKISTLLINSH